MTFRLTLVIHPVSRHTFTNHGFVHSKLIYSLLL
jgi:hypothetical protein